MNTNVLKNCDIFAHNIETVAKVYKWDGSYTATAFAASVERAVDIDDLKRAKKTVANNTGFLSALGDTAARIVTAASVVKSSDPDRAIAEIKDVYKVLKNYFIASEYLALATVIICESGKPASEMAMRTRKIYDLMKKQHRFLTSSSDIAVCAILAVSGKDEEYLVEETERCYQYLAKSFSGKGDCLMLSNMLALYDIPAEAKCRRTIEIRDMLRARGLKVGAYDSSAVLAPLVYASFNEDPAMLINEVAEAEKLMASRRGTGGVWGVGKQLRTMFAILMVNREFCGSDASAANAAGAAVTALIAEEVAITCCICASVAASCAASSS